MFPPISYTLLYLNLNLFTTLFKEMNFKIANPLKDIVSRTTNVECSTFDKGILY